MKIPAYFKRKAALQFGDAGPAWVEALPSILSACIRRWDLRGSRPIYKLSINLVVFARSPQYGEVVLKIQGPHSERYTEMTTLAQFGGEIACHCYEVDRELAAMLLERILPGDDLRTVPDKDAQLAIGAGILKKLPVPDTGSLDLPHYRDWLTRAFERTRRQYDPDKRTRFLMDTAMRLFEELDDGSRFLLHGDLHHENILKSGDGRWKVIDPQGVIAPPVFECGRFIENHVIDDSLDLEAARKTIRTLADHLDHPPRAVAGAFFILHLLSMCWGYEMNYIPEWLRRGFDECAEILDLLDDF